MPRDGTAGQPQHSQGRLAGSGAGMRAGVCQGRLVRVSELDYNYRFQVFRCCGLNVKCPHKLVCSNIWGPAGTAVWEGDENLQRGSLTDESECQGLGL